jgi:L-Ala-D/L-Glu epimerase
MLTVSAHAERWPLAEAFVISRGAKTEAHTVTVTLKEDGATGRGECVPYGRYGETVENILATIRSWSPNSDRQSLLSSLPAGAARNAIDCALWDLEAKRGATTAAALAGINTLVPVTTCYTLSLGAPAAMAAKATSVPHLTFLKLKLGGDGDAERMRAVRQARPDARLVADANEAWTPDMLGPFLAVAKEIGLELVEQPLPAGNDGSLKDIAHPVPICADESVHSTRDLKDLCGRYDAVNIKLDKAGGLTEALHMANEASALGLKIMCGCMVATSLAMAPAMIVAQCAHWVDLDGPLLLARDREHGLQITNGLIMPPAPVLWG